MPPHNRARGEVLLSINGEPRRLCVTLGALAELEAAFDVAAFSDLGARLAQVTASELLTVIAALLQGDAIGASQLAAADIDPRAAAEAVAEAFRLAFDDDT